MKAYLWTWEKHNILHYINQSNLTQFTCEELVRTIARNQRYYGGYYVQNRFSEFLFQLSQEGYITVTYVSMGNKTVPIYTKKTR
jgi:hypothetical protein